MTIGQVAREAGVTQSAIRYYEASGLLPRPSRVHGMRQYDDETVDQVKVLRFFRRAGITIAGLASISSQQNGLDKRRDVWVGLVQQRIADLDALMIEAQETKRRLEATIACECEGEAKLCAILQAERDGAG